MPQEPSFAGLRVVSLESRRAKEMEALIVRYHGRPFVAPSVAERPLDSNEDLLAHTASLIAGDFDLVVLMTGTGLSYWRDASLKAYSLDQFRDALAKATLISRGPKPVVVLHEMKLKPQVVVQEPNTWQEIVPVIAARPERRIAVQEYGRGNPEFVAALQSLSAEVTPVCVYKWELPEDIAPLREAAHRIARAQCDIVIFTTSVQLTHLLEIARQDGIEADVRQALRDRIPVASVGPIMDSALEAEGLRPDIVPAHPKMGILVRAAATQAHEAIARKRRGASGS